MDFELDGKRALVTGSSGGIGATIGKTLAAEGTRVVIHGRLKESAQDVVSEIRAEGGEAVAVLGDLSEDGESARVVESARRAFDGIDILVNNVGTFGVEPWDALELEDWRATLEDNLLSSVRMYRGLHCDMKDRGWGRVIQVASVSATIAPPPFPAYAAAKAATVNLAVGLSKLLAGTGITVNAVSPGPVLTDTWRGFARDLADLMDWEEDTVEAIKERLLSGPMANPTGRLGRPEDVASLVTFLASPRAGYINGENIRVDGGLVGTVT